MCVRLYLILCLLSILGTLAANLGRSSRVLPRIGFRLEEERYTTAEEIRNEDNAAPKQVVDANDLIQEAEAEEVKGETEEAPI